MGRSNAALKLVEGAANAPFAKAANLFEGMVKKLSGDDVLGLRHEALEELVNGEGRNLLQQLVQDHVALRHEREQQLVSVEGADGVERNHVRERGRKLVTIFGEVEIERLAYGQRDTSSVMPLDAQLNLPADNPVLLAMKERLERALTLVENRLGEAAHFAGATFTAADIIMVFSLTTMRYFLPLDLSPHPNILAYLARISQRPAYQTAMRKSDPGMALLLT